MATTPLNRVVREVSPVQVIPDAFNFVTSTTSFNQGDLMTLDTSAHVIKAIGAAADSQTFLGIAPVTVVLGKIQSSYQGTAVDASQSTSALSGPIAGVVAQMKLLTGDSLNPGDLVYAAFATDAQTVSATNGGSSGSHAIGVYQGAAITSAPAGTQVQVLLGHRYPADTLVI